MPTVFITGVSTGIGWGLADEYLRRGWQVAGCSRRTPEGLMKHPQFRFAKADITDQQQVDAAVAELFAGGGELDLAILNAGVLGEIGDLRELTLEQIHPVMDVNLWSNKRVIDALFAQLASVTQVVTVSSGAAVNGNRGWAGYSISKAALNMLTKLYARELPDTHFCALAPGIIDTAMQQQISDLAGDERFPSLLNLKSKRGTPAMPDAESAAADLIDVIARLPELVDSGDFADVRQLPVG